METLYLIGPIPHISKLSRLSSEAAVALDQYALGRSKDLSKVFELSQYLSDFVAHPASNTEEIGALCESLMEICGGEFTTVDDLTRNTQAMINRLYEVANRKEIIRLRNFCVNLSRNCMH